MRHQRAGKKLGRDSAHRKALYSNLAGALIEHIALELDPKRRELGATGIERPAAFFGELFEVGIGELDQHVIGTDSDARANQHAFHTPFGCRGDPALVARHEQSRTAHAAHEFAPLHRVDEHDFAVDRRREGLERGEGDPGGRHRGHGGAGHEQALALLAEAGVGAGLIHRGRQSIPCASGDLRL